MDKIHLSDIKGAQWVFQCDDKGRLCYSIDGAPKQILQNDATSEFDIITGQRGDFHLVLQLSDGSLVYLTYDFSNWKKYVILKSKSNRSSMSSFKLFMIHDKIHSFYVLDLNGKSMLVHHIFSTDGQSTTPDVIAYTDSGKNFSCAIDSDCNIHIFFFDESGKFHYKIYDGSVINDRSLSVEDDIKSISAISDGNIHLLYTAGMKSYCTLIYYNLSAKERKIISFSDSNISAAYVHIKNGNVFAQWRERTQCYQCISADNGISFKKPTHISDPRGRRADTIRIRTERNPLGYYADTCIHTSDGTKNSAIGKAVTRSRHTLKENDYNIIDGAYLDEIKIMQSKIRENERELTRLSTIVNAMSDKISALAKSSAKATLPSAPSNMPPQELLSGDDIGEVNLENYELFKNTEIENIESENSKTFE